MSEPDLSNLREQFFHNGSVRLHAKRGGAGPLVILLHGFPEHWRSWHHQIPGLIDAGYEVIAPDLRGYNLSDKPTKLRSFRMETLIEDVACIAREAGHEKFHLVAHDWGGLIAWAFAAQHPELLHKLVILNAPHMKPYFAEAKRPPQMFKSWYVLFFQIPFLPELMLSASDYAQVRAMFERMPKQKSAFSNEDIDISINALSQPGALTAALNYYRANFRRPKGLMLAAQPVSTETLVIWGENDPALDLCLLDRLADVVPNLSIVRIPESSHWVQNECPEKVNRALIDFLKS